MKRTRTADTDHASAIILPPRRIRTRAQHNLRTCDDTLELSTIAPHTPPTTAVVSHHKAASLHDLPAELLYEIQLLSLSASFPYTSRHTCAIFRATTPHFRARYIIEATRLTFAYHELPCSWHPNTISTWLRFGLCDLEVLKVLERTFNPPPISLGDITVRDVQLPRRLFKMLDNDSGFSAEAKEGVVQLLRYLFTPRTLVYTGLARRKNIDLDNDNAGGGDGVLEVQQPELGVADLESATPDATPYRCVVTLWPADANSLDGYGLTRAVYCQYMDVISLLLVNGAMPTKKDNLAIKVALGRKNFKLARRLLRHVKLGQLDNGQELLSSAVKAGARDVVDLLKAHGVLPDMKTVRMLMKGQ